MKMDTTINDPAVTGLPDVSEKLVPKLGPKPQLWIGGTADI
jgi:hypothetical protein